MNNDLLIRRSVSLSDCGIYRYRLERSTGLAGKVTAGIMVNPSTADALTDDHTIRKWNGFAARLGVSRFIIGNKFAFRATDIRQLREAADPIGPENDAHIEQIMRDADLHIMAWGVTQQASTTVTYALARNRAHCRTRRLPAVLFRAGD